MRRTLVLLTLLLTTAARADAESSEWVVPPRDAAERVWRQCLGVVELRGSPDTELPLFTRTSAGRFTRAGGVRLRDTVPVSDSGYHPPPPVHATTFNASMYPVVAARGAHVLVVLNARTGKAAWLQNPNVQWFSGVVPASAPTTVELLWLEGTAPLTIFNAPGGKAAKPLQTLTETDSRHLDVFEFRGDWAKVGLHTSLTTGEQQPPLGWVRVRDAHGRLRFWPRSPDSC